MFGYCRPFRPYLRVCEADTYKAIYCGLCKMMGKRCSQASRFTLSYDFAFLSILNLSVNEIPVNARRERCIAHPLKKNLCVINNQGLEYPADAAVILMYHKLRDDIADKNYKSKVAAKSLLPIFKGAYKKSSASHQRLAREIELQMDNQFACEKNKTAIIDEACDPTAKMMSAIAEEISDDADKKLILSRFGYALGRFIYICDALDDIRRDNKNSEYNPLLVHFNVKPKEDISDSKMSEIREFCTKGINLSLAELANCYMDLDLKMYRAILDNIIYVGFKNVFSLICVEKFHKRDAKSNNEMLMEQERKLK